MQTQVYRDYSATWEQREKKEDEDSEDDESAVVEISFLKDGVLQYTKTKSTYENEIMLLQWLESDTKTILILNTTHGVLEIFDAETGSLLTTISTEETDITSFQFHGEYLYIGGRFWRSCPVRKIYHIPSILEDPTYKPHHIPCLDGNSCSLQGCETIQEFIESYPAIFEKMRQQMQTKEFNENRLQDILLRRFLESKNVEFLDDSRDVLFRILSSDRDLFYVKKFSADGHYANSDLCKPISLEYCLRIPPSRESELR